MSGDSNIKTGQSNRLINEKSPYLLQHAANPVDWYPWGDEAFEKAASEDKPIFLSIGYSTCHWCHVMEHESFEDKYVAGIMNEAFVSIKVDREERPDIDNMYMTVCQMMTGSGGWPLTIIMTPDKKPFYVATYIPRDSRYGQVGMVDLIPRIREIWQKRRDEVMQSAEQITQALSDTSNMESEGELGEPILKAAYEEFFNSFDHRFAGFGKAPKFPTPHNFLFLLRYWKRSDEEMALEMVVRTMRAMRQGGIYDHLGFGFHRYSTDPQWLVPHFEKMLYDQALMAMAYIETYQATGDDFFKDTAREIFDYVLRDLTDAGGAFYSAEDADSEGKEGKFYLWQEKDVRKILTKTEVELFIKAYSIYSNGNFAEQLTGQTTGDNILHLTKPIPELAAELGLDPAKVRARLEKSRTKLFAHRKKRIHPHKDDKILCDWNGLMIAALAFGAQVFEEPAYAEAARKAVNFIMGSLRDSEGRLLHRFRDGEAAMRATLDDYAFLVWGLLNLYEATFDIRYLRDALELNEDAIAHYWDNDDGGFFFAADDSADLPVRQKEILDGAIPSGNSVAALNLLRLSRITGDSDLENKAEVILNQSSGQVRKAPQAFTMLLSSFDFALGPSNEIVIVGRLASDDTQAMLKTVRERFLPNKVVIVRPAHQDSPELVHFADFIRNQRSLQGKATAYVCRNYSCDMPTTDVSTLVEILQSDRT